MIPPQVSSVSRKPLSIGFEEIAQHKIVWTPAPVEPEFDPDAEAQAAADAAGEGFLVAEPTDRRLIARTTRLVVDVWGTR